MTEEKKAATKKTSTKKTTTKKTTAAKTKATKEKPETPPTPPERKFGMDDLILCKSVRQNNLTYVASNGMKFEWFGFGDLKEVPYRELVSMRASRSPYLYEPWLLIMDEELIAKPEFNKDFAEMYSIYREFESPEVFFEQPIDQIISKLEKAPKGLKELIVYNAGRYINEGSLDRIGVINAIDKVLGTNLRMLI